MNLNEFRRSYIKLDKASQSYITPQYVKQGDYNGRELIVQITDGGAVKDMTGVSLELGWKHEMIQNAGLEPFSELDVTQGLFKVAYPTELLNPGRVLCAIRVSENGTVTNSMNFTVTVEANPFDDTTLVSDNAFTLLEQLIQDSDATKIYEVDDRLTNQINETDTRLTSQLAEIPQQIETFAVANKVRYIAHRGMSGIAPENSLPAYELAGQLGMWGAETDVLVTSDGVWVLMHDDTVDRTTNGTGNVSALTLAQIKALKIDAGNNVTSYPNLTVPTMEEYLLTCKKYDMVPVIEIKGASQNSDYDTFVNLIKKHGFESKSIVISFSSAALQEVRNRSPKIMVQLVGGITQTNIDFVKSLGNAGLDPSKTGLTKALIEQAHAENILVNTWTVNSHQEAKTLTNYGVDFITTDIIAGVI